MSTKKLFFALVLLIAQLLSGISFASENPLFVTITSQSCFTCQTLKPIVEELKNEFDGRVNFVTLDVSSKSSLEEAKEIVSDLQITSFFNENKSSLPSVGIFCPGGKLEKNFTAEIDIKVYKEELNKLLEDSYKVCSL